MLVLTRKVSESFIIGDNIEVSVLKIMGDKVRFGIKAPADVPVHRREVWEEIRRENLAAAQASVPELEIIQDQLKQQAAESSQEEEE